MPLVSDRAACQVMFDLANEMGMAPSLLGQEGWKALGEVLDCEVFSVACFDSCNIVLTCHGEDTWALLAVTPLADTVAMSREAWAKLWKPDTWVTKGKMRRKRSEPVPIGQYAMCLLSDRSVILAKVLKAQKDGTADIVQCGPGAEPTKASKLGSRWLAVNKLAGAAALYERSACLFPTYFNFKMRLGYMESRAIKRAEKAALKAAGAKRGRDGLTDDERVAKLALWEEEQKIIDALIE